MDAGAGGNRRRHAAARKRADAGQPAERSQPVNAARHVDERRIAAEAFVGAEPAQRHLDASLVRGLGHEPGVDAVDGRQVHGVEDRRQIVLELGAVDRAHDVAGAVARGDLGGERRLVEAGALEFREGECQGGDIARAELRHAAEQRTGIEPGGKEDADRHVGHEMVAHRLVHRRRDTRARSGWIARGARPPGNQSVGHVVIALSRTRARGVDQHRRSGRQRADAAPHREGFRHAAQKVEAHDAGRVGIARHRAAGKQCLGLRGKAQRPAVVRPVERLDAERIARQQQLARARVPQAEGEHAAQSPDHRRAAIGIELQQHLGVGFAVELVALGLQLRAQFAVVVDFAVEGDREPAVGALHGLGATLRQVDDRQPPMGKADTPVGTGPLAAAVGAARGHAIVHASEFDPVDRRGDIEVGVYADNTTHGG